MSGYDSDRGLLGQLGDLPAADDPVTLPADGLVLDDWTNPTPDSTQSPLPGETDSDNGFRPFPGVPGFDEAPAELPFETVDPSTVVVDPAGDTVIGSPETDVDYWLYQGEGQGTCAPTAVAMVLADVLGVPVGSNQEVVDQALALGLIEYDLEKYPEAGGWSGMTDVQILLLAESYGLDVNLRYGDIDQLAAYLDAGHSIMVAVDADEIWSSANDDGTDEGMDANHELVVTGIDPVAGLVYLNDSGSEDGNGSVIPLAQFESAWADAFNAMIVTDLPSEGAAAGLELTPAGGAAAETGLDVGLDTGGTPPIGSNDVERLPLESPDSVPEGVGQLLILAFTFVVDLVDELV